MAWPPGECIGFTPQTGSLSERQDTDHDKALGENLCGFHRSRGTLCSQPKRRPPAQKAPRGIRFHPGHLAPGDLNRLSESELATSRDASTRDSQNRQHARTSLKMRTENASCRGMTLIGEVTVSGSTRSDLLESGRSTTPLRNETRDVG